jgi:hypothetical protein
MAGNFRHGFYGTPTYKSWSEMKYRCGKRYWINISYEKRWNNFKLFLEDMGVRPEKKSLDRIDNNKNYCKENCRWATGKEQAINRSSTHFFKYCGIKKTLTDWAKILRIKRSTLAQRIYCYKWNVEKAFSQKGGDYFGSKTNVQ